MFREMRYDIKLTDEWFNWTVYYVCAGIEILYKSEDDSNRLRKR